MSRLRFRRSEPGAALFQGLRIRLTLWYCIVLAAVLLISGITLYFLVQHMLLSPIQGNMRQFAERQSAEWQRGCPPYGPPPRGIFNGSGARVFALSCFDGQGNLVSAGGETNGWETSVLLDNSLARRAIQVGHGVEDTIEGGKNVGSVYRYAIPISASPGNKALGVLQTAISIEPEVGTLRTLLLSLLLIGAVALLSAGAGGFFMAQRALAPARLSFARQQGFIADASHELRTPLALLRADAEVLLRGREKLPEEDAALLEDIVAETTHMTTLATNMLLLARLDARQEHREFEVVDICALAQRVLHRVNILANERNISLHLEKPEAVLLIGDLMLLEQALLILVDNAIKYSRPGGKVTLTIEATNKEASIAVRDQGEGIAPEHLPHLGERFYRVDKARSRETGGTGLGLSIARSIAGAHGGALRIESQQGKGTTATLLLPLPEKHVKLDKEACRT